jgi:type IV pilus assembly protein PilA
MSDVEWFYMQGDERRGPLSEKELIAALSHLPADTQVWRTGGAAWTTARDIPELAGRLPPPPPPSPRTPAAGTNKGVVLIAGLALAVILIPVLVFVVGIVAAIAIPSLLRARVSANESATIGDLRTLVSAQAAYAGANGGFFDSRLTCLSAPATCIPGYSGAAFLDASLAAEAKSGYRRTLFPGGTFAEGTAPKGVSPSSTESFAFIAVPVKANTTGVRSFCVDGGGVVCWLPTAAGPDELVEENAETGRTSCSARCLTSAR